MPVLTLLPCHFVGSFNILFKLHIIQLQLMCAHLHRCFFYHCYFSQSKNVNMCPESFSILCHCANASFLGEMTAFFFLVCPWKTQNLSRSSVWFGNACGKLHMLHNFVIRLWSAYWRRTLKKVCICFFFWIASASHFLHVWRATPRKRKKIKPVLKRTNHLKIRS